MNNGLTSTVVTTLATDGLRVYAGTLLEGVFLLPAGGTSWIHPMPNVNTIDRLNGFVSNIVVDPRTTSTLYAATLGDGTRSIEGNAAEGEYSKALIAVSHGSESRRYPLLNSPYHQRISPIIGPYLWAFRRKVLIPSMLG